MAAVGLTTLHLHTTNTRLDQVMFESQVHLVCEPNVVQLRAHRLGILLYKFLEEFDLHGTCMGPNPEGFGSNLSRNISPNATKFFTHVLTYVF